MSQNPFENIVEVVDDGTQSTAPLNQPPSSLIDDRYCPSSQLYYGRVVVPTAANVSINTHLSPPPPPISLSSRSKCDEIQCNKIFVGGLSWDTTQEKLYKYFSEFGSIIDCILMLDGATGRSRGFGFVTFLHHESVISVLNIKQHILDNKAIDPKEAVPKHIKDIENRAHSIHSSCPPSSTNNYSYRNGCNGGGANAVPTPHNTPVSHTNTVASGVRPSSTRHSNSRRSSCVGDHHPLTLANAANNNSYNCQHHSMPSSSFLCPNVVHNTKIFVGGIGNVTEHDMRDYFSTFGTVIEVNIMMDKNTGRHRGFAFVEFSTNEAADLTASMRYHYVRNKQMEVKKALPRDTKYLLSATSNHSSNYANASIPSVVASENHPQFITADSQFHCSDAHNSSKCAKSLNVTPCTFLEKANFNQAITFDHQHPIHSTNNTNHNSTFDESIVCQERPPVSNVATPTPVGTANCSLVSVSSPGNDDRITANVLHSATAHGGEWDFDDAMHFDEIPTNSGVAFANAFSTGVSTPLRANAAPNAGGVLANNTNQSNIPVQSMNSLVDGILVRRCDEGPLTYCDNPVFDMSRNRAASCDIRPRGRSSGFSADHHSHASIANTCDPRDLTTADQLQPLRFNNVGDTTTTATLLNRQIPDDTKNSIVKLLNEIWKGT